MVSDGVSEVLFNSILEITNLNEFADFSLGGGTNLAIKYNHRESTDIDLFSQGIVGIEAMRKIERSVRDMFNPEYFFLLNLEHENLCFARTILPQSGIKVEVIQNLKNLLPPEIVKGLRLIHDDDIGALKLLAAASRGSQKDFYDLFLLTELKPFGHYYDHLMAYFENHRDSPSNIFDNLGSMGEKPGVNLSKDLSSLCDFNHSGDKRNPGNRIVLTENSPLELKWPDLRNVWKSRVKAFAVQRGLKFNEIPTRRKPKLPGFSW
ncbi:nucleotidyl transferase AbiEii/AbiGii toxin family protein [Algoriphagus sp. A40]|uniref:nucleotidyl transferase AbiEii/AbiGii toxin family protein n=1 Tax=Algoriphagus sp. A40 TaxID=1945863 RepID=UPI000985F772|nr:nucleotidyl transferase AbiEii/AbiGii toxin family protein [Algoriphagus sp. A40]OOG72284.1 hypothetical protein B0E43_15380 [Algoriphagus sp. A40]